MTAPFLKESSLGCPLKVNFARTNSLPVVAALRGFVVSLTVTDGCLGVGAPLFLVFDCGFVTILTHRLGNSPMLGCFFVFPFHHVSLLRSTTSTKAPISRGTSEASDAFMSRVVSRIQVGNQSTEENAHDLFLTRVTHAPLPGNSVITFAITRGTAFDLVFGGRVCVGSGNAMRFQEGELQHCTLTLHQLTSIKDNAHLISKILRSFLERRQIGYLFDLCTIFPRWQSRR